MASKEQVEKVEMRQVDLAAPRETFRLVNGERVRIPHRDPTKLYRTVNDGNSTYDIELTEEEHRQRREEEARWNAEAPVREAERQRQKAEYENFRASLKYENRVVAFLDVLGWRKAIGQSAADTTLAQSLGVALHSSMATARLVEWMDKNAGPRRSAGDPQITQFSDSVVLSIVAESHAEDNLVFHLHTVISGFLRLGYLVRGGIAEGRLIHRGAMVYGPALISAYDIERCVARYPRIVLDKALAERWGAGVRVNDMKSCLIGFRKHWRRDADGYYFYDFLAPLPGMLELSQDLLKTWLGITRSMLMEKLADRQSSGQVRGKYIWTAKYFNLFADEHKVSSIERIPLPMGVRIKSWLAGDWWRHLRQVRD